MRITILLVSLAIIASCNKPDKWEIFVAKRLVYAQDLYRQGFYSEALSVLDSLSVNFDLPRNYEADIDFLRARIFTEMNLLDSAQTCYEKIVVLDIPYKGVYLNLGNLKYREGKYLEAIAYYKKEYKKYKTASSLVSIGYAYESLGKIDSAIAFYDSALRITNNSLAHALFRKGQILMKLGNYEQAYSLFLNAYQSDPDNATYKYHLGLASMRIGKLDEAKNLFLEVIQKRPYEHEVYYNLSQIMAKKGNFFEANNYAVLAESLRSEEAKLSEFETLTRVRPSDPYIWATYGYGLMRLGKHKDAIKAFNVALFYKPDFYEVIYWLGILFSKYNVERSITYFEKLVNDVNTPPNLKIQAVSFLSRYYADVGSYQKAKTYIDLLISLGQIASDTLIQKK